MTKLGQPLSLMTRRRLIAIGALALVGLLGSRKSFGYFEGNRRFDGQSIVNGVDFKVYKAFPEKWKLVTTGFSDDSGQLGLVYANPIGYAHLQKLKAGTAQSGFPDGAIFGRVVFKAEKDERLLTARVPGAKREYQLMVRGASKFKSTEGWAFARFNAEGVSLSEEPRAMASACVACHSLAAKDGFVFSKLAPLAVAPFTPKKD